MNPSTTGLSKMGMSRNYGQAAALRGQDGMGLRHSDQACWIAPPTPTIATIFSYETTRLNHAFPVAEHTWVSSGGDLKAEGRNQKAERGV